MIIRVDYQNGDTVPDNLIVKYIQDKLELGEDFTIGSNTMLLALRVEVKQGRYRENFIVEGIEGTVVIIENENELFYIEENGRMHIHISENIFDSLLDILIDL